MTGKLTETGDGLIYEVFARFRAEEPMRHIGSVVAQDSEAAKLYAFTLYNEWDWSRMIVAPRRDIVTLVDPARRGNGMGKPGERSTEAHIYGRKEFAEPLACLDGLPTDAKGWVEIVEIPVSAMTDVVGGEAAP